MLYVYGPKSGDPVVVTGGDEGWLHLAPRIAKVLADRGFFVIGFDARRYFAGLTPGAPTPKGLPKDYRRIASFAGWATGRKPVLLGVSEGAGLSILAAADPPTKAEARGVVAVGVPDLNHVAMQWREAVIRLTHRSLNGSALSLARVVAGLAPLPLAVIHKSTTEVLPAADVEKIIERAPTPTRLWVVPWRSAPYSNDFFEFDRCVLEAIAWVTANSPT
jgi:pimeloyl-ACP methyl ester carboxylesterase